MVTGLIGKKVGMTQLFTADGTVYPATVLKAGPCVVSQGATAAREGYQAVQLGLVEARAHKENKPTEGHFKKAGVPPTRVRREVRVKTGGETPKAGDQINVSIFAAGGSGVAGIAPSRGKGFQGVVKRHHFKGGRMSHGSMFHRAPGSIGASSYPSRVVRGARRAGRVGAAGVTTRTLKVLRVDADSSLLLVEGSGPGGPNAIVVSRK